MLGNDKAKYNFNNVLVFQRIARLIQRGKFSVLVSHPEVFVKKPVRANISTKVNPTYVLTKG